MRRKIDTIIQKQGLELIALNTRQRYQYTGYIYRFPLSQKPNRFIFLLLRSFLFLSQTLMPAVRLVVDALRKALGTVLGLRSETIFSACE